jgi:hypothetical protein
VIAGSEQSGAPARRSPRSGQSRMAPMELFSLLHSSFFHSCRFRYLFRGFVAAIRIVPFGALHAPFHLNSKWNCAINQRRRQKTCSIAFRPGRPNRRICVNPHNLISLTFASNIRLSGTLSFVRSRYRLSSFRAATHRNARSRSESAGRDRRLRTVQPARPTALRPRRVPRPRRPA